MYMQLSLLIIATSTSIQGPLNACHMKATLYHYQQGKRNVHAAQFLFR